MGRFGQIMIYFGKSGAVLVGGVLVVGGRVDMYSSPPPPPFFSVHKVNQGTLNIFVNT